MRVLRMTGPTGACRLSSRELLDARCSFVAAFVHALCTREVARRGNSRVSPTSKGSQRDRAHF